MKQLLILISLLACLTSAGQSGVVRLEFEAAVNADIYKLVPAGSHGFMVFYESKDFIEDGVKAWFFSFYDPSFREAWKTPIGVIENAEYQDFQLTDSLLHLFFMNTGKSKQGSMNFQVITINFADSNSYSVKASLPHEAQPVEILVAGDFAYAGLNLKNEQAAMVSIDMTSGESSLFQVPYADQNFIEDIAWDSYHDRLLCIAGNFLSRRQNKLYLMAFGREGKPLFDQEILPVVEGKYLNSARLHIIDSTGYFVAGTYGNLPAKIPSVNEYFGIESTGLFTTRFSGRAQQFMNYFNFTEFTNLRAGTSARDFFKMQRKSNRETPEYSLNYEVLMHELEKHDSTYLLMMEAFYPEFRTVSDISYDYWGRPVTHTYNVFDGYRFFNSILAGISEDGTLIWDNSLEINVAPTYRLDKKTEYFFDGEPVLLFYNDGTRISYRICLESTELEPFTKMDLETLHQGDRITAIGQNRLAHWYDYYFLAYGYHTIQNNLLNEKNERTVFYINKIALE